MTIAAYFHLLVQQWHEERPPFSSSIADMIACPSYLRIIAMGRAVAPLILEQLKQEGDDPDHWHAALEAITGENPVPEDAQGDTVRTAEAWIAWGEDKEPTSHSMIEASFPTYNVVAIESLVVNLRDTTALPGQLDMMIDGGGQEAHETATGLLVSPEFPASPPLCLHFKNLDTKNAEMVPWSQGSKRSLSSQSWTVHQRTPQGSLATESGPASSVH